jgi:cyclophilin family peptidyl-prolyl cis-trans isomerase
MKRIATLLALALIGLAATWADEPKPYKPKPGETIVKMTIKDKGDIYIRLNMKEAPKTCENFLKLVKEKFYDGIRFHRVVLRFVVQAGDPITKDPNVSLDDPRVGTGGPGYTIKFEPNSLKHTRGAIGMARTPDPDSAGSQFYICLEPQPQLDGQYVIFGEVVQGMEIVDRIQRGDVILKAVVLQEAKPKESPKESSNKSGDAKKSDQPNRGGKKP